MGRRHAPGAAAERPEVLTDVLITGILQEPALRV